VEENIDTWRKEWVEWFCDVSADDSFSRRLF
jgi:hypothetical protein